jgi:exodeoxyribonuclease V alpha subunit
MQGIAQHLFQKKFSRKDWSGAPKFAPRSPWLLVERLVLGGYFSYLDYAFAEKSLRSSTSHDEEIGALLCYVLMCSRTGHLCIKIDRDQLHPNPDDFLAGMSATLQENEAETITHEDVQRLSNMVIEGYRKAPLEILSEENFSTLFHWKNCVYLQKNWRDESEILQQINKYITAEPFPRVNFEPIKDSGALLPEQMEVIEHACRHSLTLVTGGPGTGKTYTAGQFVNLFWKSLNQEERSQLEIVLAAPTGKASSRLYESFVKSLDNEELLEHLSSKTLHSLLGIRKSSALTDPVYLSADLVIVDESSMIDVQLMKVLLKALKAGSRLILLGDQDQLPPVETGNVFADLVNAMDKTSPVVVRLTKCMRSELKSILDLAKAVNSGESSTVIKLIGNPHDPISNDEIQKKVIDQVISRFTWQEKVLDEEKIMARFGSFRVLCPLRKGPLGVDTLNALCKEEMERIAEVSRKPFIAPVMITVNDYSNDLHNGEMGILIKPHHQPAYALFPSKDVEGMRRFSLHALPAFEYAYCISVHKSQGSEFDDVLILMPEGSEFFGREVLYTAVTRARKGLQIYGSAAVIQSAVDRRGLRLSGIIERLQENSCCSFPLQNFLSEFPD